MALPPPPAPPPPPPPPPIGEAIPPSYPGPAPSMQPVTTAQPAPDVQTASQPNTTPGNEDKIWERSWTVDELRKGSSNWTLAADSGFLLYLQEFSQRIISQTHDIETQVDGLINSTKGMDSKVQNTMNDFLMLSDTQFIENRVYEEDVSKDETNEEKEKAPEPEKAKTREQLEAEVIPKLSEALSHGVGVMDNAFVAVELTTEHSDDEEEEDDDAKTAFKPQVILEPKDVYSNRPLPHLIGSGDFFKDELVGLGESSGEEDEGEEDEEEASSSSSGSETESTASGESSSESSEESGSESDTEKLKETEKKQKSKPKKIIESEEDDDDLFGEKKKPPDSDEEDEKSDDEEKQPKKPKGGLDFASELAAKIGVAKVKQPDSDEDDNKDKVADGEWSDEENQESKTVEVQEKQRSLTKNSLTKSRSDSKTKEKKSHHHHHHHHQHHDKRERSESQGEHKHRKRRGSKTSHSSVDKHSVTAEDDLFSQSSPQEDGLFGGEGTPFTKKGGLFSGGGNLFDDVDEDKGDLFAEASTTKTNKQEGPTEAEEESVQVKPRARSTASGKKIPAGAISIFGDSGLFGSPTKEDITTSLTKNHQKHEETETKPKPKSGGGGGGLFDGDDDDDLFSGTTFKPSAASPLPAGAVSMFGSSPPPLLMGKNTVDDEEANDTGLFKASAVAPKKTEVKTSPASQLTKSKSGGGLFSDEDEEEGGGLFGASATKPQPKEEPKSRPKTKTTISLFDDDDEQDEEEDFFAAPAVSKPAKNEPTKDKPKEEVKETKAPSAKISGLFDDDDEDLFNSPSPKPSPSPNVTRKEDKKSPQKSFESVSPLSAAISETVPPLDGTAEVSISKAKPKPSATTAAAPKASLFSDEDDDLFGGNSVEEPKPSGPLPVPKAALSPFPSSVSPKTSPVKLGSGIEKLQKSLAFNPAMLRPGAAPPKKEAPATVASFDEPAKVTTLESTNKARAKVQVKRRPPTRQARRAAAATSSASDASLFGTLTNEDESISARVSWGGFPSPEEGLGKSEVDSGQRPSRTETKDSDMSDEFFGFTSSGSTRVKKDVSEDPLAGGLFSDSVSSKPKVSTANELFKDDSDDLFSISIEKTNKTDVDDPFSVGKTKEENKPKTADPLITNDSSQNLPSATSPEDDLFSSGTNTKERKSEAILKETPSKDKEDSKISSPLDNEDLLSAVPKDGENVTKTIAAKDTLSAKLPANLSAKAQSPVSDGDLFASSTGKEEGKSGKGEKEKTTADKKFPSPLGDDDDDLFAVSAPAKKETKTISDSAAKKTASPLTSKKAVTKGSSILDEDDDELFSVKKTEARKPKKVVKPLGDDDLFGDSGDIFSDIPSKPKGPKKKKSATTAPKDDIFAEGAATGGDEQAPKKTATKAKKKTDKKPKTSIFDDDVPSIFDDPLNATSK
ncbi:hypothetical protein pdam_00001226 [Pocillopora damicornis]|uniref:FAM21/CAPZIP domain-containing protein n=1 Tax=Pocillopora damicornis TaxID=46731 RepID=A0A3M6TKY8_POCDA|nr:hypothetical protein pdam_00001226 [Pocillopora damicornis]